jgi:hypothetical protein
VEPRAALAHDVLVRTRRLAGDVLKDKDRRADWNTLGVAAQRKAIEQATDELYDLPPAEFTGARDERAKALRKEGKREEADAVKAMRKPTVAAWALNQLARQRAKEVERLLAAGEALRAAQDELLGGGDRKAFQSAAAKEREEVAKLAGETLDLATEAGERPAPMLREKITATLHAAALDEETAEELRAGRLVREREAIGGFGGVMAAPPAPARGRGAANDGAVADRSTDESKPRGRKAPAGSSKRGKAAGDDAKRRAEAEKREAAELRQRVAAARTDERHARRELEAAAKAVEHAQSRAEAAKVHAEEATARAKVTAERLKETRREQTAAKKAHARAERALAEAERAS